MKIIIITGQIASGKTTTCKILKGLGCAFINADQIVHDLYKQKKTQNRLSQTFGKQIISGNKLNRKKLAPIVFKNKKALKKLNSLIHPLVFKQINKQITKLAKTNKFTAIEIPLFFQTNQKTKHDYLLIIKSAKQNQIKRLQKKGLSRTQAMQRIKNQAFSQPKTIKPHYTINNNKNKFRLKKQVKKIFEKIKKTEIVK